MNDDRVCVFDPICGSRLPYLYRANPHHDGDRTFYFCSEACRTHFLEHGYLQRVSRAADPSVILAAPLRTAGR